MSGGVCLADAGVAAAQPVARDWVGIAVVMAGVAWGANQFAPLLLVYRTRDHLSETTVTATFGVYALSLIPTLLAAGTYSDRHGPRAMVRLGALLSVAATLVMIAAGAHSGALYAGRLLAGLASGVTFTAGSAWLTELSPSPETAARRSTITLSAGFGAGPLIAGAAGQWLPAPTLLPYLIHVGLMVVVIPLSWQAPGGARALVSGTGRRPALIPGAARTRRFLLGVLPWAPWVFGTATVGFTTLPAIAADHVGKRPIAVSGAVAGLVLLSGIAVQPFARRLGRDGRARTQIVGLVVATVALATCALPGFPDPVLLEPTVAMLLGAAYGILLVAGLVEVEGLAHHGETAGLLALFYVFTYLGLGEPYLLALLASNHGHTLPLLIAALITLATIPLAAAGARRPAVRRGGGLRDNPDSRLELPPSRSSTTSMPDSTTPPL